MPTRNIHLTEHYDRFIGDQVDSGKYQNASEVLRAGLRLLEQETVTEGQQRTLLKKLADEGFRSLDQGAGLALSDEHGLRDAVAQIGRRAAKAPASR